MTKLSYEDLKEYISMVLDLEKASFVESQALKGMKEKINLLGIARKYNVPTKRKAVVDFWDGIVCIVVGAILLTVYLIIQECVVGRVDGFFGFIITAIASAVIGVIVGGLVGFVGAVIVYIVRIRIETNKNEKIYIADMAAYDKNIKQDRQRIEKEKIYKTKLNEQYNLLHNKYTETNQNLRTLYNFNIIHPKYRNIIAVASFFQYLSTGKCRSLVFDPQTGDRGAYNIFDDEEKMNRLITNTEIIIKKIDDVIEYQETLHDAMQSGMQQANRLIASTEKISRQLDESSQKSEIAIYNQEQTLRELEYLNRIKVYNNRYF